MLQAGPGNLVVDVCAGTGELGLEVQRQYPESRVLMVDFAEKMLRLARTKVSPPGARRPLIVSGDALCLPLANESCAGFVAAFGVRNLNNARAAIEEAHRVLKPGGRLALLDFYRPVGALARTKWALLTALVPLVVALVVPQRVSAYRYLVNSVAEFFSVEEMCQLLENEGFTDITVDPQLLGVATVLGATRA